MSLRGITKRYGAVTALRGVDLDVIRGDVLAICGDNGAGKSTLIRIMSGAAEPSEGTLALAGAVVRFRSPHSALGQGVAAIYQDLALAPRLSIAANVFMGSELTRPLLLRFLRILDKAAMTREAQRFLARLSVRIDDIAAPVERLSGGQRQAVAIARVLRWDAGLIIMDEPTAALGVRETAEVLDLIRHLRDEGRTIVLVSHNMRDVVAVANRVAILKNGGKVIDRPIGRTTADELGHMVMIGTDLAV
jgi:simple sugar transport system ATP-binding protein